MDLEAELISISVVTDEATGRVSFSDVPQRILPALVDTYGKQAVDVFYVKDLFGLKLHAEGKRDTLEARLRAVIDQADGQTS